MKFLVAPRVLAATLAMPVLVLIGDIIGVMGGYLIGVARLGFNPGTYIETTLDFLEPGDVTSGLVKAAVFGAALTLIACRQGFYATGVSLVVSRSAMKPTPSFMQALSIGVNNNKTQQRYTRLGYRLGQ